MTRPVLLLTRPEPAASRFHGMLEDAPAHVLIVSPLLSIRHRATLPEIPQDALLLLTSANAARAYAALGGARGRSAVAVGDATAEAARAAGLEAKSAGGDVENLLDHLLSERPDTPLLHLRGAETRGRLTERLVAAGFSATEAVIYDQPLQPMTAAARDALAGPAPVVAPLFSPRTAAALAASGPFAAPLHIAAMSEAVKEAARSADPAEMRVAKAPDAAAMALETVELLHRAAALEAGKGAE